MNGVHIRQADGGYIIDVVGRERVATTLEETLAFLVHHFYGIETVTITIHPENQAHQAHQAEPQSDHAPAIEPPNTGSEALSEPVMAGPPTFTCPICKRNNFQRMVGVIGHAYAKHGQTLTAKDIRIGSIA